MFPVVKTDVPEGDHRTRGIGRGCIQTAPEADLQDEEVNVGLLEMAEGRHQQLFERRQSMAPMQVRLINEPLTQTGQLDQVGIDADSFAPTNQMW